MFSQTWLDAAQCTATWQALKTIIIHRILTDSCYDIVFLALLYSPNYAVN